MFSKAFMRPILSVTAVSACAVSLVMTGCGGGSNLYLIKNLKSVAIVQIASNKTVEWEDRDEGRGVGAGIQSQVKMIGALAKGKKLSEAVEEGQHSTEKAINSGVDLVYEIFRKEAALPIIGKEIVLTNAAYMEMEDDTRFQADLRRAEGYKVPPLKDNPELASKLCDALGVDALLTVEVEFAKNLWTGVGSSGAAKANADVMLRLYDRNGECIWWDSESEYSEKSIGMGGGAYDYEKMDTLAVDALGWAMREALRDLKDDLEKLEVEN
ncbi:MAG: hypothetical protein ACLFSB_15445 [Chitinispirillaceae bacterium]